jgi:hypothetical protein
MRLNGYTKTYNKDLEIKGIIKWHDRYNFIKWKPSIIRGQELKLLCESKRTRLSGIKQIYFEESKLIIACRPEYVYYKITNPFAF